MLYRGQYDLYDDDNVLPFRSSCSFIAEAEIEPCGCIRECEAVWFVLLSYVVRARKIVPCTIYAHTEVKLAYLRTFHSYPPHTP